MCSNNILIFDHYSTTQISIDTTLTRYSRIRDYFWNNPNDDRRQFVFSPFIVLASILAQTINSTVVSNQAITTFSGFNRVINHCPTILPQVQTNDLVSRKILFLWSLYYQNASQKDSGRFPNFVQVNPTDGNFVYCQVPKREKVNLLSFSEFTEAFDKFFWILIIAAGLSITIIIGVSKWPTLLSVLLSSGLSHKPNKLRAHSSFVLVIWMFCATILSTLYSGSVTSTLISPPEDDILSNIEDLERSNFTLLFQDQTYLTITKVTYELMPEIGLHSYLKVIKRMLRYAEAVPGVEASVILLFNKVNLSVVTDKRGKL